MAGHILWGSFVGEGERRAKMRAMLCHCRHRLEAEDDERLLVLVREHLIRAHPTIPPTDEQVMEIVSTRAYNLVYVEVPADEELAPEPFQRMVGRHAS
jgi:hypothetical protein